MKKVLYPKWEELPEIDLYLDQVLLYVNQLSAPSLSSDKGLTAAMVNNYVKHGHISKPIKKKYSRHQLARLIVITAFKNVFSIQDISQTLSILTDQGHSSAERYNDFVACMNHESQTHLPEVVVSACQTVQLYQHTHALALSLKEEN